MASLQLLQPLSFHTGLVMWGRDLITIDCIQGVIEIGMYGGHFPGEDARRQDMLFNRHDCWLRSLNRISFFHTIRYNPHPLKQPNRRTSQRITSTKYTNTTSHQSFQVSKPGIISTSLSSPSHSFPYIYEFSSISLQAFSIRSLFTAAFCALTFCLSFLYH